MKGKDIILSRIEIRRRLVVVNDLFAPDESLPCKTVLRSPGTDFFAADIMAVECRHDITNIRRETHGFWLRRKVPSDM